MRERTEELSFKALKLTGRTATISPA